jgi:hypothetical protein
MFVQVGRSGSAFVAWQMKNNDDIGDEMGWPEFVDAVADAYHSLTPAEHERLAILADNYGEAGALELYGPAHGLPEPIALVNSFHERGYGAFPPENVLVTGQRLSNVAPFFESCRLAGEVRIPYGVVNEESRRPEIYLCHHLRGSWDDVWKKERHFG